MLEKKTNWFKETLFFIIILFLTYIPIFLNGTSTNEDYFYSFFSLEIISKQNFSPFIFFHDLFGPGIKFPLGNGLFYFFPTHFFINDILIYYFFTIAFCLYLQFNYLKKILKFYNIKNYFLLIFLHIFNISLFAELYSYDHLKIFVALSFFPAVFYYAFKFMKFENAFDFFKLILFLCYLTLNCTLSYVPIIYIFLILFFIINNKFFFLKKRYFYLGVLFSLLILSENIYRIYLEYISHDGLPRDIMPNYSLKHFFSGLALIFKFFETFFEIDFMFVSKFKPQDNYFLAFTGIFLYFSLYEAIRLVISRQSRKYNYLNILFLIFFSLSLIEFSSFLITSLFIFRDIFILLAIIIFGIFLQNLSYSKVSKIIIVASLTVSVMNYVLNFEIKNNEIKPNFIKKNNQFEKSVFFQKLKNFENKSFDKVYLSPKVFNFFHKTDTNFSRENNIFYESNVFSEKDLRNYNLYSFNLILKNASVNSLITSPRKMYTIIKPKFDEINNELFLKLFKIKYLLIYEDEIEKINFNKFKIIHKFDNYGSPVFLLESTNNKKIVLKNYISENKNFGCPSKESVKCILKNKEFFKFEDKVVIKRIGLNKYLIKNESDANLSILVPFIYDDFWKIDKNKIMSIDNALMFINLRPGETNEVFYRNDVRLILKVISIIAFLTLVIFIIKNKLNILKVRL